MPIKVDPSRKQKVDRIKRFKAQIEVMKTRIRNLKGAKEPARKSYRQRAVKAIKYLQQKIQTFEGEL